MVYKKLISVLLVSLFIIAFASAITGTIGNARMILRLEQGETIQRSIQVINKNNVTVNIEVSASGELEDKIEIIDKKFTLEPDEEKNAYFIIRPEEIGSTESRIHIKFEEVDESSVVGLASTIILIVYEQGYFEANNATRSEGVIVEKTNNPLRNIISIDSQSFSNIKQINPLLILVVLLILACFLLITLLFILTKTKTKKQKNK